MQWKPISLDQAQFTVEGRLDFAKASQLRKSFEEAQFLGITHFFLDLHQVEFMDSAGLAAIISGLRRVRSRGGELYIERSSPAVQRVLQMTLLDQVIPVHQVVLVERG